MAYGVFNATIILDYIGPQLINNADIHHCFWKEDIYVKMRSSSVGKGFGVY